MDVTRQIQIVVAWADIILCHPVFKVVLVALFIFIGYLIGQYIMRRRMKMAKYTSLNDVVSGHITALIEANNLDAKDYPYQNDVNSAIIQLANIYAAISDKEVPVAADSFSIAGAVDALLDVVDSIVAN